MSKNKVIELARADLGYTENPPGSNLTKYGEAYGMNGVPWCVEALWFWFNEAGERMAFLAEARRQATGLCCSGGQTTSSTASTSFPGTRKLLRCLAMSVAMDTMSYGGKTKKSYAFAADERYHRKRDCRDKKPSNQET